jgi:hypothetical protein
VPRKEKKPAVAPATSRPDEPALLV